MLTKRLTAVALAAAMGMFAANAQAGGNPIAGKAKAKVCAACHGLHGVSTDPQFPILAGQYADYIVQALKEYKDGQRKNPIMAAMAAPLSQQDREDLAAWFASQPNGVYGFSGARLDHRY